jgi:DinB superfamily
MTGQALMLARLAATPVMRRELTSDVSAEQATTTPSPRAWSIVQVVRHLVEADRDTFLPRLRRMVQYATHMADHDLEHLAQMAQAPATALAAG